MPVITTKGDLITTGEWLLGVSGDWCLGPTDNSVGVWSRADFTALQRRSDFTINHQLCMSGCGWRPRTDAAKCDTHFYVLFQLGNNSLEDLVIGVIDTVYTGFDFRTYLFICSRRGGHCLVGINGTNRPAVTLYYLFICSGHLCLRRERGRPVELYNACSVDIGGGRSQEGDRAGGTPASSQMHSLCI